MSVWRNAISYFDQVVHETLRFHARVPDVIRIANKDDVLPPNRPSPIGKAERPNSSQDQVMSPMF